ncbi:DUF4422 domain-containing protein [[Clostridium] fimetarium]|uniref:DUF4422 domain-containing protein n=1 Tax=[Clostridium] fimetarium TaxID=99656 RepID=A0A1I0P5D7_9FIRM|nr:DUF4422 domain-containing protein [[Clostridium] fimetarium]SEW09247.1 protein of unknown function [[Clostridium] fimetarium]
MYYAKEVIEELNQSKQIVIFGARIVAVEVASILMGEPYLFQIPYFLVTDLTDNPSQLLGRPVIDLKQSKDKISPDDTIVIASMEKNIDSICENLRQFGFLHLIQMTFESDLWSLIRGNYYMHLCKNNHKPFIALENELKAVDVVGECTSVSIYTAKCHVDKKIQEDTSRFNWEIPIQVGTELTKERICKICDNEGDNISIKNSGYCELTALYWIWKNDSSKYKGLGHYRRHFELDEPMLSKLSCSNIDVILTIPIFNFPSVGDVYKQDHNFSDWNVMMEALEKNAPEYCDTAKRLQNGIYYYGYNMFVAKREIFDDYCKWLFPILTYCEEHCGKKEDRYQNRYIGFLAERLLSIYFRHHEDRYKIVHAKKHFIEK